MSHEDFELVRGSRNGFHHSGRQNGDVERLRAILAAQVSQALEEWGLTQAKAERLTGIAAADFSRIRRGHLGRFTIDRLIAILNRLNRKVDVRVTVHSSSAESAPMEVRS
jgi:predicted XRE-type DNA-binding protein